MDVSLVSFNTPSWEFDINVPNYYNSSLNRLKLQSDQVKRNNQSSIGE